MSSSTSKLRVLPCGPGALLVEVDDAVAVAALHRRLVAESIGGVSAIVPAARTVLVEGHPSGLAAVQRLVAATPSVPEDAPPRQAPDVLEIPVVYDGADLEEVATRCRMSATEVIRRHSDATYTAAFCGFSPGFAYLVGGDPALHLARRNEPRTRVPAGSVAIAGDFSAVYPSASPGGWHLLGRTSLAVWNVERDPPALLAPGATVRFVPQP